MKIGLMGAGYVGMAVLESLCESSHDVFISTTTPERVDILRPYGTKVTLLTPTEDSNLREFVDFCDILIILIAPKNPDLYEQTYLNTAQRISRLLKNRQKPLRVIYTSSTSVYEGNQGWVAEDAILTPKSHNAKILLQTEGLYLKSGAEACILRLGGIYGPDRELTKRAKRLSGKEMPGTGMEPTNNIHLDDVVRALFFCLENELCGIYNLVNDDHTPRKELYEGLCKTMNLPVPLWNNDSENTKSYQVSNKKIKNSGFLFKHSIL